jgi:guanylate kinase
MGHIFAICGCSGVGKTTFLNALFATGPTDLRLLVRTTGRAPRKGEREGVDYKYLDRDGFLQKIFANDFVHVEEYEGDYFGIEARYIEDTIRSRADGIIMAGAGAMTLRAVFGANVSILFLHTGTRESLLDPGCLRQDAPENIELKRRLQEKVNQGVLVIPNGSSRKSEQILANRMEHNLLDLAFINGRIRSGEQVLVLENLRDRVGETVAQFTKWRAKTSSAVSPYTKTNSCFVLMPFSEEMKPVYQDHIARVVTDCGLSCQRADQIFSTKPIMDDIRDAVRNARIVIADLTSANPNVFYETGICHAMGKDVILLTQDTDVPFDLRHIRQIRYRYTPPGMKRFEEDLEATLKAILRT